MPNEHFSNKPINILKASLPFLPGNAQRFISYYIKIEEFNILCNNLNDEIDNDVRACENDSSANSNDLVNAIKPYLNNSERELVDMFINMTNALNMYTAYKSLPNLYSGKSEEDISISESKENYEPETYSNNGNYANDNFDSNNSNNNNNSNFNNINIDMLKNMLSPSQKAMFDTYSSMLNN